MVLPSWITESVKAGKLLPWRSFELRLDVPVANALLTNAFVPVVNKITRHLSSSASAGGGIMAATTTSSTVRTTITHDGSSAESSPTNHSNSNSNGNSNKSKWIRENSSIAPDFVAKFFQSSRLHYLSSWKNELRQYSFSKADRVDRADRADKTMEREPGQRCIL